jgi:LPS-assembly lipoprotein
MAPSSAFRIMIIVVSAISQCGCGFQPMLAIHDGKSSVADDMAHVKIGYIEGRSGQVLRNDLVETLNPRGEPEHPQYTLVVRIDEPQQNLAYQRDNSVTNVGYGVNAYWVLVDKSGGQVFGGGSSSSQLYENSNSQYATTVSAQNVRDRIMLDISTDIRNKMSLYFINKKEAAERDKAADTKK